jgi:hypothetical protein
VRFSGRTLLFVNGKELGRVPRLAICREKTASDEEPVLLCHCDEEWKVLGCSGHSSRAEAKQCAERIYPGISVCWTEAHISKEEAELYLQKQFGKHRCIFCGKTAAEVGSLIQKAAARICNFCIDEFYAMLHEDTD